MSERVEVRAAESNWLALGTETWAILFWAREGQFWSDLPRAALSRLQFDLTWL